MERRNLKQSCIAILLTMLLGMVGGKAVAHDIAVANQDGVTIYYSWINNNTELAVSFQGDSYDAYADEYSGNIVIPESVEYGGLYDCSRVTSVAIPNSVTSIYGCAFGWCYGMTSVNIPNNVVLIDGWAFYMCNSLTSLTIPKSVTTIGEEAFSYCGKLTSIKVESGNPKYDSRDNCNAIIEKGTNQLIVGCENTIIPNSVTSIGHHVFLWCRGLKSLTIPNSVTAIGNWTFGGCTQLVSATIPKNMKSIGMGLFSGCRSLTTVTIPSSVTAIGDWAFNNCPALATIYVQTKEPVIFESSGSNAFGAENFQQATVYVPIGSKSKYEVADVWKKFSNIVEMEVIDLGDGNGDGTINAADVKEVANYIMGSPSEKFSEKAADANEDGTVNAADIVTIVNILRHATDTPDKVLLWFLVTNRDVVIPMSQVGMLVAADDSPYFSVLDINGNVLAEDVLRVHFLKLDPAGVENTEVAELQNMLKRYVNNQLTLVGAQGTVNVYSVSGVKVASVTALDGETLIDVSAL